MYIYLQAFKIKTDPAPTKNQEKNQFFFTFEGFKRYFEKNELEALDGRQVFI